MEYDPSIDIAEDPEVYPPSDDSILLIESLDVVPGEKVLEVGCGSGVVSIHCAKNGCDVTAVDVNPRAVELARRNAGANGADIPVFEVDCTSCSVSESADAVEQIVKGDGADYLPGKTDWSAEMDRWF